MRRKILIVENSKTNRDFFRFTLSKDYEVEEVADLNHALNYLALNDDKVDAILLGAYISQVTAYGVMEQMRGQKWFSKIPILIIGSEYSTEKESIFFSLGAADFLRKPFDSSSVLSRIKNLVELYQYRNRLQSKIDHQTVTLKQQYQLLNLQAEKLKENNDKIVEILGTLVEFRNLESKEHIKMVKGFSRILATQAMKQYPEYKLTEEKIHEIVSASSLHDLGKITIPDKILLKPGKLTKDEYEYMKSHTLRGCDMLQVIQEIWTDHYYDTCYEICRSHHEKYDGKGYPDGLKGDEIPISAQIVAIADVYDALISERVYKKAYSKEEAFHMITHGECGVFSPRLMECFRQVRAKLEEFANKAEDVLL